MLSLQEQTNREKSFAYPPHWWESSVSCYKQDAKLFILFNYTIKENNFKKNRNVGKFTPCHLLESLKFTLQRWM
ncbi:hypothetical protein TNCV_3688581 [Trichonephila clavipes]|nr:hypothetical protein TNCV_3688581 [Trichonephila clavipes]